MRLTGQKLKLVHPKQRQSEKKEIDQYIRKTFKISTSSKLTIYGHNFNTKHKLRHWRNSKEIANIPVHNRLLYVPILNRKNCINNGHFSWCSSLDHSITPTQHINCKQKWKNAMTYRIFCRFYIYFTCDNTKQKVMRWGIRLKRLVVISSNNIQMQAATPATLISNENASNSCR